MEMLWDELKRSRKFPKIRKCCYLTLFYDVK